MFVDLRLQARVHAKCSGIPKVPLVTPLAAHLEMSRNTILFMLVKLILSNFFAQMLWPRMLEITQGRCVMSKKKNIFVPLCAFFMPVMMGSSVSTSAERDWTQNTLTSLVPLDRGRNKVMMHYQHFYFMFLGVFIIFF